MQIGDGQQRSVPSSGRHHRGSSGQRGARTERGCSHRASSCGGGDEKLPRPWGRGKSLQWSDTVFGWSPHQAWHRCDRRRAQRSMSMVGDRRGVGEGGGTEAGGDGVASVLREAMTVPREAAV
jgi:hypothetical protein